MGIRTKLTPLGSGRKSIYKKKQVVFEAKEPGNYNLELLIPGRFKCYCISGGAGALRNNLNKHYTFQQVSIGGGSGAAFIGIIRIPAGTIPITVGNGGIGQSFTSLNYGVNSPS